MESGADFEGPTRASVRGDLVAEGRTLSFRTDRGEVIPAHELRLGKVTLWVGDGGLTQDQRALKALADAERVPIGLMRAQRRSLRS
jgi:hypothetical protein